MIPKAPIGFRLANELEGLLVGMNADGVITAEETDRLRAWLLAAKPHETTQPFASLIPHLERALADGQITLEESEDLLFVTQKLTTVNPHFDALRAGVQVLMGVMTGVAADGTISSSEVAALEGWLEDWRHLKGLWPYDECDTAVVQLLLEPDNDEARRFLLGLSECFPVAGAAVVPASSPLLLSGLCATDPAIEFAEQLFVFTGRSPKCSRAAMEERVHSRDGVTKHNVTQDVNYLVVCDEGNPYWAFACYGRKVEQAYNLRREGHPIVIVAEHDFWDALVD
jgi:hypothetical protein